jgi:hypothetical protein
MTDRELPQQPPRQPQEPRAQQRQPYLPHRADGKRSVPDTDGRPPAAPPDDAAFRRFLWAVHQALDLPAPYRSRDRRAYLTLLERRARLACASIGRLIADPRADALDYASEGDHLLHQVADLPAYGYRHHPKE